MVAVGAAIFYLEKIGPIKTEMLEFRYIRRYLNLYGYCMFELYKR